MPKFEVLLIHETSTHYYIEAEDEDEAVDKGVQLFEKGEPDQNASAGWSKLTSGEAISMEGKYRA